jgi:hypothetical protein
VLPLIGKLYDIIASFLECYGAVPEEEWGHENKTEDITSLLMPKRNVLCT